MQENNKQLPFYKKFLWVFAGIGLILSILLFFYFFFADDNVTFPEGTLTSGKDAPKLVKFKSEQDFKQYLQQTSKEADGSLGMMPRSTTDLQFEARSELPTAGGGRKKAERVSDTNVQVKGIDEPDIVKTDGSQIYLSSEQRYYIQPVRTEPMINVESRSRGIIPPEETTKTRSIKAFPPAELEEQAEINKRGNLLLVKDTLVVFADDGIWGYDVGDPENPEEVWDLQFEDVDRLVGARLYEGNIYLITQARINRANPCPVKPLSSAGNDLSISCSEIYHPDVPFSTDVTYTAMMIDPQQGSVNKKVSFVGSSGQSVVYMSADSIYATYTYFDSVFDYLYGFYQTKGEGLVPQEILDQLEKVAGYDLSERAKVTELRTLTEEWQNSLDQDEQMKVENELNNRMQDYAKENLREFEKTGISKIAVDGLKVEATGAVPGRPLNQFSLDEYQGNLRIATTISSRFGGESANDVYILDNKLAELGSVKDLGLDERIYSVRFINDQGYVVTFKQVDPFYVLDLSEPANPQMKGKLKIPGYSSYLHPLAENKILGIGKEDNQVKLSLFDVSNSADPQEVDKYLLDEYWSDVLNTHHAFLLDQKHDVFFLPGSKGGYIFSFANDQFVLEKAVQAGGVKRALYLDDYLYVLGEEEISVFNENDWTEVNSLQF